MSSIPYTHLTPPHLTLPYPSLPYPQYPTLPYPYTAVYTPSCSRLRSTAYDPTLHLLSTYSPHHTTPIKYIFDLICSRRRTLPERQSRTHPSYTSRPWRTLTIRLTETSTIRISLYVELSVNQPAVIQVPQREAATRLTFNDQTQQCNNLPGLFIHQRRLCDSPI